MIATAAAANPVISSGSALSWPPGQFAAVDEILTGRENLVLVAKLRHLPHPERIADALLARFRLRFDFPRRRLYLARP